MGSDAIVFQHEQDVFSSAPSAAPSSFWYSFSFLPRPQRSALKIVYAFCRVTDDIVDTTGDVPTKLARLQAWRHELASALHGTSRSQLLNQLMMVAKKFNIPIVHFNELIEGVEMDLVKNRYQTFEELREYCYHVASSVGLMCLGIFGSRNEQTKEYAVNLGIALQLTNIIRDVGIDASYGRIYLPIEDLRAFGCTEEDVLARRFTPAFVALMEFETKRAEEYFQKAQQSLPVEERSVMFAATIMERIYLRTLRRIKSIRYNVFDRRVAVPRSVQFMVAVKYWLKHRVLAS